MKSSLLISLSLATLPLAAEPSATPPAPVPTAPAGAATAGFANEQERVSTALGIFFANRDRDASVSNPEFSVTSREDFYKGLQEQLEATKSVDYVQGASVGAQLRRSGVEMDNKVFLEAFKSGIEGKSPRLDQDQVRVVIQRLQSEAIARNEEKKKAANAESLKKAQEWLEKHVKEPGVLRSPSGLQYKIESEGSGESPSSEKFVKWNFTAHNQEGVEFDKNPESGPARRGFRTLPKGLQEGLKLLKVGGKATFWLPPDLGYGEGGRAPHVKGNTVTSYKVELVGIEDQPKPIVEGQKQPPISAVTPPVAVEIPQTEAPKIVVPQTEVTK